MANTKLSAVAGYIDDIAGNAALEITTANGVNVKDFNPKLIDTTKPELLSWELTLANTTSTISGSISLTVNESIVTTGFDVTDLTVKIGTNADYTLTDSTATVTGRTVSITLSTTDATALDGDLTKNTAGITTTTKNDITLAIATDWAIDLSPIPNTADAHTATTPAIFNAPADIKAPELSSWDLDLTSASTITLRFNEVVGVSTFTALNNVTISGHDLTGGTISTVDSDSISIELLSADRDAVLVATGNTVSGTTITMPAGYVNDLAGNPIAAASAVSVTGYTSATIDTSKPTLSNWTIVIQDAATASAVFTCDKTLSAANIDLFTISIEGTSINIDGTNTVAINGSQITATFSSAQAALLHGALDITAGVVNTVRGDIFLQATADWATDNVVIANTAAAITGSTTNPLLFGAPTDNTPPTLINWDLDLEADRVTLVFDEMVDVSTLDFNDITIAGSEGNPVTLTGGTLVSMVDSNTAIFSLNTTDAAALLQDTQNEA